MTRVAVLECKSGSIAEKSGSFASLISQRFVVKPHNVLCINVLTPKRSKLKNFAPKISSCVQLIVLSVRNANIVFGGTAEELGILSSCLGKRQSRAVSFELFSASPAILNYSVVNYSRQGKRLGE